MSPAPTIYPTLRYDDAHGAVRFLADAFGFEVRELHEGSDGGVDHALVAHGSSVVMVSSRRPGMAFDHGQAMLYVAVDDPEGHLARAQASGAKVVMALTDQPYGSREYAAEDPEGNVWCFGTYHPAARSDAEPAPSTWRTPVNHVAIQCADVAASASFYDAVLPAVGAKRVLTYGETIGYGVDVFPSFWIGPLTSGEDNREVHLAFAAATREGVNDFYRRALDAGAVSLHEPRLWPEYHANYYGGFVRDPDGNNVEAVCHLPEDAPGASGGL